MRSAAVLDRDTTGPSGAEVHELLVMWQHPETREIVPIGRFSHADGGYSFVYTRAVEAVKDFRPLLGLPDTHRRYDRDRMPAVFNQRVMSPERPDYGPYLEALGLSAAVASPWEQIVESGGSRAGDTLQFLPMPSLEGGRARARFLVNGLRHVSKGVRTLPGRTVSVTQKDQEDALRGLRQGDAVVLEPENDNPKDPAAVIVTAGGVPVGWVPRALAPSVRELLGMGSVSAVVHRIGAPEAPPHLRLVLDLDTAAPVGFVFDREDRWAPLAG